MRWIFAVLAALAIVVTTRAWGQTIPSPPAGKPSSADEATAKKNFDSGLRLYGEGSYAEALIAFEQSYRVGGRPSALKNVAQCHRNLKHFVEAYEAYEALLERHEAQLPAADKTVIRQALDELGVLSGAILVVVNEADADIEIDGKVVAKSPMAKAKRVSVATHVVRVNKPTFAPNEREVAVASQETKKIEVKLEPEKTTGRIVVREQNGRDVRVYVDGEDKGPAPWEGEVAAGEHVVEAKSARYASEQRHIKIAAKERADIGLDALALTGHLRITTVPASATIALDDKLVGSGAWEGDVPEGPHRIEVRYAGQPPQVREITVARGQLIVQEIPVVAALATGSVAEYPGIYVRLAVAGMIGAGNADDGSPPAPGPNQSGVTSNGGVVVGGTASVRVGNAFDWWGIEGVATFMLEHRERKYEYRQFVQAAGTSGETLQTNVRDNSTGPNLFLGVGARATTKGETVRFSFGLAPGIAIRNFSPSRDLENCGGGCGGSGGSNPGGGGANHFVQNESTSSGGTNGPTQSARDFDHSGYTAFALMGDAGVLIGSTPGTKFFFGVQAWLDFPPGTLVFGPDTVTPASDDLYKRPGRGVTLIDGPQFYLGPTLGLQFGH